MFLGSIRDYRKIHPAADSIAPSISFANEAQFLLVNRTSVEWLVDKVDEWTTADSENPRRHSDHLDETVDRFRANLIVETAGEFDENTWHRLRFGDVEFRVHGPCTRCQMICINQRTGEKTTEPLRTISREFQGKMRFGIYMSHRMEHQVPSSAEGDIRETYIECGYDVFVE